MPTTASASAAPCKSASFSISTHGTGWEGEKRKQEVFLLGEAKVSSPEQKPYLTSLLKPLFHPLHPTQGGQEAESRKNSLHPCWETNALAIATVSSKLSEAPQWQLWLLPSHALTTPR